MSCFGNNVVFLSRLPGNVVTQAVRHSVQPCLYAHSLEKVSVCFYIRRSHPLLFVVINTGNKQACKEGPCVIIPTLGATAAIVVQAVCEAGCRSWISL